MKLLATFNGCLACLFLIVFLGALGSSPVMAKVDCDKNPNHPTCPENPDDPPPTSEPEPDPDDPCRADQFDPDYVFYRDTGDRKNPAITLYLAESWTGCEKAMVEFPALGENGSRIDVRYLKFSSIDEQGFGRVVWRGSLTGIEEIIWSYDFYIASAEVVPNGGIRPVLVNDGYWNQSINAFDLSPDTAKLAFKLFTEVPDSGEHYYSIRMIDIEGCIASSGCLFDDEKAVVLAQTDPEVEFTNYLSWPTWGPLGERVYFKKSEKGGFSVLQYAQFDEGWQFPSPAFDVFDLYSSETDPEYPSMRGMASGIMGEDEYLAVEFVHETVNCGYIYFLNVDQCIADSAACFTDVEFTGTNPSWTKAGKVIHHYYDPKADRRGCSVYGGQVGIYDGDSVSRLTDGFYPDGSGG
jgi:hypothetical protein